MNIAIVIPVYKENPDEFEIKSFIQCLKILDKYSIIIVYPQNLDVSLYIKRAKENNIELVLETFEPSFFADFTGYNNLMTSVEFYSRFERYEYMLIYQLDAYVFIDELEDWCKKGYDYIGAPWFDDFRSYEEGAKLWAVGNGGVSLRKVSTYMKILKHKRSIKPFKSIYVDYKRKFGIWAFAFLPWVIIRSLGLKNTIEYFKEISGTNEDYFWTQYLNNTKYKLNVASIEDAIKFSFDKSPSYLYSLNGKKLPFVCHGWPRYEYDEFWSQFIH